MQQYRQWKYLLSKYNQYIPIIILMMVYYIAHHFMVPIGDDAVNENVIPKDIIGMVKHIYWYYCNWLPSVLPTIIYGAIVHHFGVWRLLDTIMVGIIAWGMPRLFLLDNEVKRGYLFFSLVFMLYPFTDMGSAGWIATTVRYLWVFAFMLIALQSIRFSYTGLPVRPIYVLGILLCTAISGDMEQSGVILWCIFLFFAVYLYTQKKPYKLVLMQFFVCCIDFYYLATSPGNKIRFLSEIKSWYPQYIDFTVIDKFNLGVTATIANRFFLNINPIYILLIVAIIGAMMIRKLPKWQTLILGFIYLVPLCFQFGLRKKIMTPLTVQTDKIASTGNFISINWVGVNDYTFYVSLSFCVILIVALLIGIYLSFDNKEERVLYNLIFLAGLCSRIMLGFSPTIYASSTRTFMFFDFSMLIVAGIILLKFVFTDGFMEKKKYWIALFVVCGTYYIHLIKQLIH